MRLFREECKHFVAGNMWVYTNRLCSLIGVMGTQMRNAVFWDIAPCGPCENRLFGGNYRLHHQGAKDRPAGNNVSSN
jgi:hypothetical protein